MEIPEGTLVFSFSEEFDAIKFDDSLFYRKYFGKQHEGKGVDIVCRSEKALQFIEIKDCQGFERDNLWRTSINNSCVGITSADPRGHFGEDSFDVEVAKKVASTIACLYGAWAKMDGTDCAKELVPYWKGLNDKKIQNDQKPLYIILFLEGDFSQAGIDSRKPKMIMQRIEDSIRKQLSWLKCNVSVVNSSTYSEKFFSVRRELTENT